MKNKYDTPVICVEGLARTDILCESREKVDNYTDDYNTSDSLFGDLFNWDI